MEPKQTIAEALGGARIGNRIRAPIGALGAALYITHVAVRGAPLGAAHSGVHRGGTGKGAAPLGGAMSRQMQGGRNGGRRRPLGS